MIYAKHITGTAKYKIMK